MPEPTEGAEVQTFPDVLDQAVMKPLLRPGLWCLTNHTTARAESLPTPVDYAARANAETRAHLEDHSLRCR